MSAITDMIKKGAQKVSNLVASSPMSPAERAREEAELVDRMVNGPIAEDNQKSVGGMHLQRLATQAVSAKGR